MPKISVDLSQADLDYLEAELADGGAKSINDLLARAIADYRRARGLEELDRLAQEGADGGEPIEITPDYWERKKQEFLARRRASAQ